MNFTKFIPFAVTAGLVLEHIMDVFLTPSILMMPNSSSVSYHMFDSIEYAAYGLLVIFVLILCKVKLWKFLFLGLLLLSFSSYIQFSSLTLVIGIGSLHIELIPFTLLIFHLILNSDILTFLSPSPSQQSKKRDSEDKIAFFEKKLESKDSSELAKIIEENQLTTEAIEAAKRLRERKNL